MKYSANTIYLRRRTKVFLPDSMEGGVPINYVASMVKNMEALGYTFSESLIRRCRLLTGDQLYSFYHELVATLRAEKGADKKFKPMYPNFPKQVMDMSQGELYLNAVLHYLTGGAYIPQTKVKLRRPLIGNVKLKVIDLGSESEFETLFAQIAGSNASLSDTDKADLEWFFETYGAGIERLLPEKLAYKENLAYLAGLMLKYTDNAAGFVSQYCGTTTDVLRIAASFSGGDVSLAESTKFRTFSRKERRLLLELIERCDNRIEDMLRWKKRWIRLGEKLHPGEFQSKFPKTAEAFGILRNDTPYTTFRSKEEVALEAKDVNEALSNLVHRPGELARRLDHLIRLKKNDPDVSEAVLAAFGSVVDRISTPVLLQVRQHFKTRNSRPKLRVFLPKGNAAKAQAIDDNLPYLPQAVCDRLVSACDQALIERFSRLPALGKCFVDTQLSNYLVPFSQRSASKSLRTVVRGSRLPLPQNCRVLRFFIWWKNGAYRTDIDLSATLFDENFNYIDVVSYYNLKTYGGCHSGDIVDAPNGASEFIDIDIARTLEAKVRYVVMSVTSYTQQPYSELPECFAGWMAREHSGSGEIYEPKTVHDRLDLTANTRIAIPLIIDLLNLEVIWCDLALKRHPSYQVNVEANKKGIAVSLRSFVELNKPNLYDLLMLHVCARGQEVTNPKEADTIFSLDNETQFRLEEIASQYMQ